MEPDSKRSVSGRLMIPSDVGKGTDVDAVASGFPCRVGGWFCRFYIEEQKKQVAWKMFCCRDERREAGKRTLLREWRLSRRADERAQDTHGGTGTSSSRTIQRNVRRGVARRPAWTAKE